MAPSTPTPTGDAGRGKPGSVPIGFGSLWRAVRRYSLLVFVFALLAAAAGAVVWFFLPLPKMTARVVYFVNQNPEYRVTENAFSEKDSASFRNLQANYFRNRLMLNTVLQEPGIGTLTMFEQDRYQEPIDILRNSLRVDWTLGAEHLSVSMEGDNQAELLAVMNAVNNAYIKHILIVDGNRRQKALAELEKLKGQFEQEARTKRAQIKNTLAIAGSTDPLAMAMRERFLNSNIGTIDAEMVRLNLQEIDLSMQLNNVNEEMRLRSGLLSPVTPQMVEAVLNRDEIVIGLERKLDQLRAAIQQYEDVRSPDAKDPKGQPAPALQKPARLLTLEKERAEVEAQIKSYKDGAREPLAKQLRDRAAADRASLKGFFEQQIGYVKQKKQEVQKQLTDVIAELNQFKAQNEKVEDARAEMVSYEKLVEKINTKLMEMRPEAAGAESRVRVWEPPYAFYGIEGNRRLKYTAMAVVGFLVLGLVLAQWLELRHRRIQTLDEITNGLGLKVLGTVPAMPKGGVNAGSNWPHLLTEAVNTTRTMLLSGPSAQVNKTLLVTSAMSGEGKTSLTTHLAVSLANAGRRVMLIDADMRRPAVHRVLGLTSKPGLAEMLIGLNQLSDVVQTCKIPNLHLLPAGSWSREAAAALSSDAWPRVLHEASQGFDFVLVDSPPILPVADALAIARNVDGVLISIMQDQSRYGAVQTACQRLNMVGAKVLGVVVSGMKSVGGYYYYYYYDERYSKPNAQANAQARAAEEAADAAANAANANQATS